MKYLTLRKQKNINMESSNTLDINLESVVDQMSEYDSFKNVYHQSHDGVPFPSSKVLREIVELVRSVIFPGYFGNSSVKKNTIKFYIGVDLERLSQKLYEQVLAGLCFNGYESEEKLEEKRLQASQMVADFISSLPAIRQSLMTDVVAAYDGDPAAKNYSEIILCYPTTKAVSNYRIAHQLLKLGVPLIPRMISEMAHSETGIDIHPGAQIGDYFTIDHGTGVVIGETAILGNHVKLYQGVTLGAKSFQLDENGNPVKDVPRHPILQDNVIVYSNASVLGRITIGHDAVIGGNVWVTHDVAPGEVVLQYNASNRKSETAK